MRHTKRGPGIWRENCKSWKMRHTHCRTWNMAKKNLKMRKIKNAQCRTWNMVRKLKTWKMKNAHFMPWNIGRKLKNVENETHTLQDLEYGEKTAKGGK